MLYDDGMGGWLKNDPTRHVVRYAASSGYEYDLTLIRAVKLTDDEVPSVLVEHPDGSFFFGGRTFRSLDEAAREFGCVIVDFVGAELGN